MCYKVSLCEYSATKLYGIHLTILLSKNGWWDGGRHPFCVKIKQKLAQPLKNTDFLSYLLGDCFFYKI